ncbi:MAG: hypothetical protein HC825_12270 [Oscillatoriales cyanobacterium RM1_1_9]|nr:hypothetical protein [Oscillatoriales cyanobacterium RM1_1_9]
MSELTQGDTAIAIDSLADVLVDLINDAYLELDKVDRSQQQMEQVAEKLFLSVWGCPCSAPFSWRV